MDLSRVNETLGERLSSNLTCSCSSDEFVPDLKEWEGRRLNTDLDERLTATSAR